MFYDKIEIIHVPMVYCVNKQLLVVSTASWFNNNTLEIQAVGYYRNKPRLTRFF